MRMGGGFLRANYIDKTEKSYQAVKELLFTMIAVVIKKRIKHGGRDYYGL